MAAKAKPKKNTNVQPTKKGEILGILLILAAILLTLALVSYHASDPSIHTVNKTTPSNFVGRVGAFLASALLDAVGYAAYFLPILFIVFSYFFFTNRKWQIKVSQLIGYIILLGTVCAFIRIVSDSNVTVESGGIVGMLLGDFLFALFGSYGSYILLTALFLISLVVTVDLRFSVLAGFIKRTMANGWAKANAYLEKRMEAKEETEEKKQQKVKDLIIHGKKDRSDVEPEIASPPPLPKEKSAKAATSKVKVKLPAKSPEPAAQIEFVGFTGNYQYPSIDLLEDMSDQSVSLDEEFLREQSEILEAKLRSFKIEGKVVEVHPGPVITMFEFEPAPGVKVAQIANREDDLAMALRAQSIRIVAPIPGKGAVGIEIPNINREMVSLRELIASERFQHAKGKLPVVLGKDIGGHIRIADLASMPHLLVAGTTGSGKSVFVNSLICSLLYRCSPNYLRMLMVDPKMLELSDYGDIPHLLYPVVTDPRKAAVILRWAVGEMEDRYRKMADMGVRNIENYNKKVEKINEGKIKRPLKTLTAPPPDSEEVESEPLEKFPYLLIVIDELSDLMIVAAKEVEESITRLAQMARAAGIHLMLATQRPSVDVITGVIKANFPSRIAFKVSSKIDSRTILDQTGADNLLGKGDMLFSPPTSSMIERLHGAFVSEEETQRVVAAIKESSGKPQYDERIVKAGEAAEGHGPTGAGMFGGDEEEELVERAWEIIRTERKASISYIQRRMKIGYNKAAGIIESLEHKGFISPSDGTSRPREILIPEEEE